MVTLAPRRGDPAPLAHPLGRFVFSQQVAPLGLAWTGSATRRSPGRTTST